LGQGRPLKPRRCEIGRWDCRVVRTPIGLYPFLGFPPVFSRSCGKADKTGMAGFAERRFPLFPIVQVPLGGPDDTNHPRGVRPVRNVEERANAGPAGCSRRARPATRERTIGADAKPAAARNADPPPARFSAMWRQACCSASGIPRRKPRMSGRGGRCDATSRGGCRDPGHFEACPRKAAPRCTSDHRVDFSSGQPLEVLLSQTAPRAALRPRRIRITIT
jgi:hypothetical protein